MTCRICLEDHQSGPLLSVCDCSGSCKHVHRECLQKWIDVSQSIHCELCRAEYTHNYVAPSNPPPAVSSHTFQAGVTATAQWDCTVVLMFCIWCGNLHGALLAINIWEGYTFKHCLVFACLFFNMGHVFAWGTIYNIHVLVRHKTALVSVLWLLSVTFGAGMASVLLNSYNDDMAPALCLNALFSIIGLVLSVPTVQTWIFTLDRGHEMF